MSLTAHRVGRIPTPEPATARTCWRCGQIHDPSSSKVSADAPCKDCREVLRAEGDTTAWDTRTREYRAQQRARAREGAAA